MYRQQATAPLTSLLGANLSAMSHWDYVLIAYGLTAAALVLELVLLFARRRRARITLQDQQP